MLAHVRHTSDVVVVVVDNNFNVGLVFSSNFHSSLMTYLSKRGFLHTQRDHSCKIAEPILSWVIPQSFLSLGRHSKTLPKMIFHGFPEISHLNFNLPTMKGGEVHPMGGKINDRKDLGWVSEKRCRSHSNPTCITWMIRPSSSLHVIQHDSVFYFEIFNANESFFLDPWSPSPTLKKKGPLYEYVIFRVSKAFTLLQLAWKFTFFQSEQFIHQVYLLQRQRLSHLNYA